MKFEITMSRGKVRDVLETLNYKCVRRKNKFYCKKNGVRITVYGDPHGNWSIIYIIGLSEDMARNLILKLVDVNKFSIYM